ncbi:phosphatase PAP2 family protein [Lacticaseibacillus yichunensis]|uniref:Phosphatase PAP2 family protein n=1 Tax=Lacticaseibacillus yichunensis TaxID=2486015 RepID=A0ABW4CN69_9LACO|nr:phosphatase PAP2 family protein [Lacticaseibacillus yichunensis]
MKKRPVYPLIIAALSGLVFLILLVGVTTGQAFIAAIDKPVIAVLTAHRPAWLTALLIGFTTLGEPVSIVILGLILAAVLYYLRKKRYAVFAFISIVLLSGGNSLVKHLVRRPRPFVADPAITPLVHIGGYSFPSGHASGTMLFWGTVILLVWSLMAPTWAKWTFTSLSLVMIIFTDISRIYVQVHYPTDVLAGASGALAGLMLIWWLMWPWLTAVTPTGWHLRRPADQRFSDGPYRQLDE